MRILEAAIPVFALEGVDRGSIQKVADRCGVNQTAILHHFPSKDALIQECVMTIVRKNHGLLESRLAAEDDAFVRLRKYGEANCAWALENPDEVRIIILLYHLATFNERFAETYSVIRAGAQKRIHEFLLAGAREGIFRELVEPEAAAAILHETLIGGIINAVTDPDRSSRAARGRLVWLKSKWSKAIRMATGYSR